MDDILNDSDDEEESNKIVNQVLDEIGIEVSGKIAQAPSAINSTLGESTRTDKDIADQLSKLRST